MIQKSRVPKTLACGHSTCSPCLKTLVQKDNINCPKCRTPCPVSFDGIDKLPTSYGTLDVLDTACQECKDQLWTIRCDHCNLNLCMKCEEKHTAASQSNVLENLTALKKRIAVLQEKVGDDEVVNDIKSQGNQVIQSLDETYEERAAQLQDQHELSVSKVKAQIIEDTQNYFKWKESFSTCLHEARLFIDKSLVMTSLIQLKNQEELEKIEEWCAKRSADMERLLKSEPGATRISHNISKDFEVLLAECDKVIFAKDSSDSNVLTPVTLPDYTAATIKNVFTKTDLLGNDFTPWAVMTSPQNGNIIVTDIQKHVVCFFAKDLQLTSVHGGNGTKCGQFDNPYGVAVTRDGSVIVVDQKNCRLQIIHCHGNLVKNIGSNPTKDDKFNGFNGIAIHKDGLLYVCDQPNGKVQVLNIDGVIVNSFNGEGCKETFNPYNIAMSQTGKFVVIDLYGHVYIFEENGQCIKTILANTEPQMIHAEAVAVDNQGNIIISNTGGRRGDCLVVLNQDAEFLTTIGKPGSKPGELCRPRGVAITDEGDILVCDFGNHRVQQFSVPKQRKT